MIKIKMQELWYGRQSRAVKISGEVVKFIIRRVYFHVNNEQKHWKQPPEMQAKAFRLIVKLNIYISPSTTGYCHLPSYLHTYCL